MIKTLAHKQFYIKKHAVGENRREIQNLSGVLFGNERLVRVFSTEQHIELGDIVINQLTNSSTLRPLRCGACCTTHLLTHLHERILPPWSARASFTIWEC